MQFGTFSFLNFYNLRNLHKNCKIKCLDLPLCFKKEKRKSLLNMKIKECTLNYIKISDDHD